MKSRKLILFVVASLGFALSVSCKQSGTPEYVKKMGMIWNTTYHITYQGSPELGDSIIATLNDVGHSLSVFDSTSVVSKINANIPVEIDSHFTTVFEKAKEIHRNSDGAFDPTLSPVITAWGFGKGHAATPDTAHLDSLRQFVGLDKISLSQGKIVKEDSRVQLNLSAIAKGYGCDAVAKMFHRNGVENFMIEIGGEITVGGVSPRGGKWVIAIEKPEYSEGEMLPQIANITFSDGGLATSGNYRNFHGQGANRFGHTIDPVTCRPIQTDVLSATVIAPTSMEADAYATSCMVLGSARAKEMISKLNLPAFLVINDSVWASPAMEEFLSK
jgi:thiamine biosynthesis lipoprotein